MVLLLRDLFDELILTTRQMVKLVNQIKFGWREHEYQMTEQHRWRGQHAVEGTFMTVRKLPDKALTKHP